MSFNWSTERSPIPVGESLRCFFWRRESLILVAWQNICKTWISNIKGTAIFCIHTKNSSFKHLFVLHIWYHVCLFSGKQISKHLHLCLHKWSWQFSWPFYRRVSLHWVWTIGDHIIKIFYILIQDWNQCYECSWQDKLQRIHPERNGLNKSMSHERHTPSGCFPCRNYVDMINSTDQRIKT